MATVGSLMVDVLAEAGVRRVYTVPGESFLDLLDGVEQHPDLTLISTRHEGGASFMAEGDGKLTGIPAVAMATRGVGSSNLAIGVHTAYQDSTPMIVLLGQVESEFLHREAFQEVDLPTFYGEITKWSVTASRADRIPELLARAVRIATTGRPGPVMIALPADLLAEAINPDHAPTPFLPSAPTPTVDAADMASVAQRLTTARAPVIIAGGGARGAREELIGVAEAYNTGVYAGFRRQDVFPHDHPLYLGHLGVTTPGSTLDALQQADLVLVVGSRLTEITTQGYSVPKPGTDVIQIDIDPASVGAIAPLTAGFVADARRALRVLLDIGPDTPPQREWTAAHGAWEETTTIPPPRSDKSVDPSQAIAAMKNHFPADTLITNDAGNFSGYIHQYWRFNHPDSQLGPCNGAMGYGVPAAIGAKLARPDRTVVATAGDGGFLMSGAEIEVAVRYNVPLTILVFRNGLYGTIALHQGKTFGRTSGCDIGEVDIAGFARSLGADAITVDNNEGLDAAFKQAASSDGVMVLDLICDPDLITTSSRLSDVIDDAGER